MDLDNRRARDFVRDGELSGDARLAERRFGRTFTFLDPDGSTITIYDRDAPPEGWESVG
jgi:hypothetical protein